MRAEPGHEDPPITVLRKCARLAHETTSLQLYPRPYRWFFTPGLQYLAVEEVRRQ